MEHWNILGLVAGMLLSLKVQLREGFEKKKVKEREIATETKGLNGCTNGWNTGTHLARAQRVGIFNFRVYRVRVLLKTSGSGRVSGIFAKKNYQLGIFGY